MKDIHLTCMYGNLIVLPTLKYVLAVCAKKVVNVPLGIIYVPIINMLAAMKK